MAKGRRSRSSSSLVDRSGLPELIGRRFSDVDDALTFESAGEAWSDASTGTVPRAHESVRRSFKPTLGVSRGVWGVPPITAVPWVPLVGPRSFLTPPFHRGKVVRPVPRWHGMNVLRVAIPRKEKFCVQRKVRRSVLFSKGLVGFKRSSPGSGGYGRRYRRSAWSNYRCA